MYLKKDTGSIGISELIIFIAVILVAGIAASVFIAISSTLETRSLSTGFQTTSEVSTALKVTDIEGHNTSGLIDKLLIAVTPRAGSTTIDFSTTFLELSNASIKCIFNYTSGYWVDMTAGVDNLFSINAFPASASQYGLIVLRDQDGSCTQDNPLITAGDMIGITINTTACFNGMGPNTRINGLIVPEIGAGAVVTFQTPTTYAEEIFRLQPIQT